MPIRFAAFTAVALALLPLCSARTALAQADYPNRPITIVVPFPPGGVADQTARPVAAAMEKILNVAVVVSNKPAAAGAVGMSSVANAKPGGCVDHDRHGRPRLRLA